MALLAQNQNHHHVKPLNSKVKRLQLMLEIRRLVLDGHSYSEIQEVLGIPRRSFYRLLDRVFQHDKRVLEAQNTQQVIFQLALLESRYNSIFQELASIGRDNSQNAADRMNALAAMAELSRTKAAVVAEQADEGRNKFANKFIIIWAPNYLFNLLYGWLALFFE
jgi:DNA-binding CsgD family transcriptional regulator